MYLNGVSFKRFEAALKNMAIGDSVGYEFEFRSNPDPKRLLQSIAETEPLYISDDTQMTLFGVEAMNEAYQRKLSYGETLESIKIAYLRWLCTQGSPLKGVPRTGLLASEKMFNVRAPGNTCIGSLEDIKRERQVYNNSNGCGTVMRSLPFILEKSPLLCVDSAFITHHGNEINQASILYHRYMVELSKDIESEHTYEVPIYTGGGWTALSCLRIARHSLLMCKGDFTALLKYSILHDGDSDSTAALAGALYGMRCGTYDAALYDRVYEKDVIDKVLEDIKVFFIEEK